MNKLCYILIICLSTKNRLYNFCYCHIVWMSGKKEFFAFDTFDITYTWQIAIWEIDARPTLSKTDAS